MKILVSSFILLLSFLLLLAQEMEDPYLWLEEVEGEKTMEWVLGQNKLTVDAVQAHPEFDNIKKNILMY